MTRRASRVDDNQAAIVSALRAAGCCVQHLHAVGKGCPDLLVGFRKQNFLLEVKDGAKPPSKQSLTDDQIKWHDDWRGRVYIVRSETEALEAVGIVSKEWVGK